MSTLDCENLDTLCKSLEKITGINRVEYDSFLSSFDIYDFYDNNPRFSYPEDVFVFLLKNEFRVEINHLTTCWFHITRAKRNHNYAKGIFPLNTIIDNIWEELFCLVNDKIQKDDWISFRHCVQTDFRHHNADLYRDKIDNSVHWGPYGFLAKDLDCFDEEFLSWHYFDGPEIVGDICKCVTESFNIDLLKLYKENTLACVVKFEIKNHDMKDIGHALFYLYTITKGEKISRDDNICFTTRGQMIKPDCIKSVKFL